ncbi:MAG: SpoIID/LytB domain-containing protein, partial [Acidobacteria bacterium]|nr:SpoIID/LytB domain-containing protein [Acidobacteriota bacterium]
GAVLALFIAAPGLAEAQAPITSTTSTSTSTTLPGTPTTSTTLPLPTSSIPASGGSTSSTTSTVPPTTTTTFVPNPARKWKGSTVELRGHGCGHGRGLGQYGSLGYATDEDIDYAAILDHYYGNTAKGTQPDGPITVRLTDMDNKNLIVTSGAQFTIGTSSFPAGGFGRVRRSAGTWLVEQGTTCSNTGVWTTLQTVPGDQQPTAQVVTDGGDDITKMLTVCGTNRRTYRGSVKAILNGTVPQAVNVVNMEQYLRGVVPRESPASWGDVDAGRGINALRAQAVSARSYAWAEQRNALYKTCDTTACQVYGGAGLNGVRIEDSRSDRAVAETATEVRILDGKVARTEFSSSTGGYTAGGTFPATPDAGDDTVTNPNHSWSATVGVGAVEAAFPTTGYLASIVVTDRNGLGEDGGRVLDVRVTGSAGSVTVSGEAFRSAL